MYIDVKNLKVTYKDKKTTQTILENINIGIDKGEFICLLGPSGSGKSTLINAMAGFVRPSGGSVTIDGKTVEKPSLDHVMIFQNYGLLPWRTVEKNVELGLEASADKHQRQLSGGMQQRVAIARGLAVEPEVLFMDEPFGALDAITRMKLQDDILEIVHNTNRTVVFVTHDIEEAVFLADRIVILDADPGRIKSIVNVALPRHRDRTSDDFLLIRDKVYEIFNMKSHYEIEYYL